MHPFAMAKGRVVFNAVVAFMLTPKIKLAVFGNAMFMPFVLCPPSMPEQYCLEEGG